MPKPINIQRPEWTQAEMDALLLLKSAGWSWAAIATHVSAVSGVRRTSKACAEKGRYLLVSLPKGAPMPTQNPRYDDDIEDLMLLDLSVVKICDALSAQYGREFATSFVYGRMKRMGQKFVGWRRRASGRRSRGVSEGNRKRAAA